MDRSELLALAATVTPSDPLPQRICATGIREHLTQPGGSLRRAREAAAALLRAKAAAVGHAGVHAAVAATTARLWAEWREREGVTR